MPLPTQEDFLDDYLEETTFPEGAECPICSTDDNFDNVYDAPVNTNGFCDCKLIYHKGCLENWLTSPRGKGKCPTCRRKFVVCPTDPTTLQDLWDSDDYEHNFFDLPFRVHEIRSLPVPSRPTQNLAFFVSTSANEDEICADFAALYHLAQTWPAPNPEQTPPPATGKIDINYASHALLASANMRLDTATIEGDPYIPAEIADMTTFVQALHQILLERNGNTYASYMQLANELSTALKGKKEVVEVLGRPGRVRDGCRTVLTDVVKGAKWWKRFEDLKGEGWGGVGE